MFRLIIHDNFSKIFSRNAVTEDEIKEGDQSNKVIFGIQINLNSSNSKYFQELVKNLDTLTLKVIYCVKTEHYDDFCFIFQMKLKKFRKRMNLKKCKYLT